MSSRRFLVFCFAVTVYLCVCFSQHGSAIPIEGKGTDSKGATKKPAVSKSVEMCNEYSRFVFLKSEGATGEKTQIDTCVHVEPIITGAPHAQAREFPHMALIGFPTNSSNTPKWACEGSLISERFVLSSAQCSSFNDVKAKYVRLGENNYLSTEDEDEDDNDNEYEYEYEDEDEDKDKDEDEDEHKDEDEYKIPADFEITKIIIHPEFDSTTNNNDIALYRLDRDVEFNEYMRPICLNMENQLNRRFFITSVWGSTTLGGENVYEVKDFEEEDVEDQEGKYDEDDEENEDEKEDENGKEDEKDKEDEEDIENGEYEVYEENEDDEGSSFLLKQNVSYVPEKECRELLLHQSKAVTVKDNTMICATTSNSDLCQEDTGSPLQYPTKEPYCMYSLVGINSFGSGCGEKLPTVYTRVSYFVPWIESIVWP